MSIGYLLIGIVWAVITLPNVLRKTNNSSLMASLLTVGRVLGWPVLVSMYFLNKKKELAGEVDLVEDDTGDED